MKVPEGRPTIARRFNGGFRLSEPIESRRDERKHLFVRAISAAPSGLYRFAFGPTVETVGYFLSSRWDLICTVRTTPEVLYANTVYAHNPSFRRKVRGQGTTGRDYLWAFVRHWLSGLMWERRPQLLARLPSSYCVGHPLPPKPTFPSVRPKTIRSFPPSARPRPPRRPVPGYA